MCYLAAAPSNYSIADQYFPYYLADFLSKNGLCRGAFDQFDLRFYHSNNIGFLVLERESSVGPEKTRGVSAIDPLNEFRRILESNHAGIWVFDFMSDHIFWDEGVERLFGLETGRFYGTLAEWFRRVHVGDLPRTVRKIYASIMKRGQFEVRYQIDSKHGLQTIHTFGYLIYTAPRTSLYCIGLCYGERGDVQDANDKNHDSCVISEPMFHWMKRYMASLENQAKMSGLVEGLLRLIGGSCDVGNSGRSSMDRSTAGNVLFSSREEKNSFFQFSCKGECHASIVFENGQEVTGVFEDLSMVSGFVYCNHCCRDDGEVFVKLCINGHKFFSKGKIVERQKSGFLVYLANWWSIRNELARQKFLFDFMWAQS